MTDDDTAKKRTDELRKALADLQGVQHDQTARTLAVKALETLIRAPGHRVRGTETAWFVSYVEAQLKAALL